MALVVVKPGIRGRTPEDDPDCGANVAAATALPAHAWAVHHPGLLLAKQGDGVGDDQRQQDEAAEGFQPHQSLGPG